MTDKYYCKSQLETSRWEIPICSQDEECVFQRIVTENDNVQIYCGKRIFHRVFDKIKTEDLR